MRHYVRILLLLTPLHVLGAQAEERLWYAVDWEHPTEREDDSELKREEIKGYRIYYGDKSGDYTENEFVPTICWWGMSPWSTPVGSIRYGAIKTVDTEGRESVYSKEFRIGIPSGLTFMEKLQWLWYGMKCLGR